MDNSPLEGESESRCDSGGGGTGDDLDSERRSGAMLPLVCLMGPTATGKTDLAIELARSLPIDIVSVDSTMVYRGLDIGTGKPDPATLKEVPHGLVDVRDAWDTYSVYDFLNDARALIAKSQTKGRLPLLVGGTMLYFHALKEGLAELPRSDARVRAEIEARGRTEGWKTLYQELKRQDPRAAAGMTPENAARITRALEVAAVSGRPISWWWEAGNRGGWREDRNVQVCEINLDHPNRQLHWNLMEMRLDTMFRSGFVEEVETLRHSEMGLTLASVSMRAVGYRQIWQGLEAGWRRSEMQQAAFTATRRLAKRQRTWLRRFPDASRMACDNPQTASQIRGLIEDALEGVKAA